MVDFTIDGQEISTVTEGEIVSTLAEATPLLSLKKRREQIVNDLYIDIKVPRWDNPELYLRFKPVSATKLGKTIEKYQNKAKADKNTDWSFLANAEMLLDACIGIYAVMGGDKDNKLSLRTNDPHGPWTRFDEDMASALGVEATRATDVVVATFFAEGDLIETANRLFRWSNIANNEADETF
jgi:hypothetical protein